MDKLILPRRKRRTPEIVRLEPKAVAVAAELAAETGYSVQSIVSQMVLFCKDRVELADMEATDDTD